MKSSNDAFLRTYPRLWAAHICTTDKKVDDQVKFM